MSGADGEERGVSGPGGAIERDLVVVEYPESDGKPMAESDLHREEMTDWVLAVLHDHFAALGEPVYVSGNNFLYYRRGNPRAVVSPDCYVVKGLDPRLRPTFKTWQEGERRPCFVLEITSHTTREEDLGAKMMRYRDDLVVPEYFLYDLAADWIPERLRGYRLRDGVYQPVQPGPGGRLLSSELGLELAVREAHVRFFRPGAPDPLPTVRERLAQAERGREQERLVRERVERELAAAREELRRLRREPGA